MLMVLKLVIHFVLILLVTWIIQLIRAFIQGIREGIQEDKEVKHQEELKRSEEMEKLKVKEADEIIQPLAKEVPLLEHMAIALACPFRAIQIDTEREGISPHLQKLGCLDDETKESLKSVLNRDFDLVFDAEDVESVEIQMLDCLSPIVAGEGGIVLKSSISLHIITACIDLGYVQFDDCRNLILYYMKEIRNCNFHSWNEYAEQFLKEEKESKLNTGLGRILFKYQTGRLLEKKDSPWTNVPWKTLMDLQLDKQFLSVENRKNHLMDWQGALGCVVSDKISVDGCKVGYMYREEPLGEEDSGWVFFEGNESEEYCANWANHEVFHLGIACNYDLDIVPHLKAPYGSTFQRDHSGRFQKIDY